MPTCDMCGREVEFLKRAIVEGSMISVCDNCSVFGKVIEVRTPVVEVEAPARPPRVVQASVVEMVDSITPDYASIIKNAREKINLKQEDVAQRIAEKESVIHNIEAGHLEPSIRLARKFEQFFRIKLIEHVKEEKPKRLDLNSSNITIGDLLNMKK